MYLFYSDGFASELDCNFSKRVEAPHVVDKRQVFVGCVQSSDNNVELLNKHKNLSKPEYQNEIGRAVKIKLLLLYAKLFTSFFLLVSEYDKSN